MVNDSPVCEWCNYRVCRCPKDGETITTAVLVEACTCGAYKQWGSHKFAPGHLNSCAWSAKKQR